MRAGDPKLLEYVRITHAATLHGKWATADQVEAAVVACATVNAGKPTIPATLAIFYGPWHGVWPQDEPPTTTGKLQEDELAYMRDRFERLKTWIEAANRRHGADARISAVLLDSECFLIKQDNPAWNEAMTRKLNAAQQLAGELVPGVRIEWYNRGIIECACKDGWDLNPYFTWSENITNFSVRLYTLPEIGQMREAFRRTVELARSKGVAEVTPWISIGAGYRRDIAKGLEFDWAWDYDLYYSWQFGAEINHPWYARHADRFAPWDAAKVVIFFPKPFMNTTWVKHFVAYVCGENGVRELPFQASAKRNQGSGMNSTPSRGAMP